MNYVKVKNGEDGKINGILTCVSNHLSKNKSMFIKLNESMNGNVAFGDDSNVLVKNRGNILFCTKNGSH